jgi:hypothetical protein
MIHVLIEVIPSILISLLYIQASCHLIPALSFPKRLEALDEALICLKATPITIKAISSFSNDIEPTL